MPVSHSFGRCLCTVGFAWVLCCLETAQAVGIRIPNQDSEALGRANAFVATADNASAVYYNPAGLTLGSGQEVRAGMLTYMGINSEYESPSGARARTHWRLEPVPQLYYKNSPAGARFTYGLGVYSPYGLGLKWPDESGFRTLAIEGRILYARVNPAVAWRIHSKLSIAAGVSIDYSKLKLQRGIGLLADDYFEFQGSDLGYGYNAGLLWQPHAHWSVGVTYRSASTLNYRGQSEQSPFFPRQGTAVEVEYPQTIVAGLSFRPNARWNLEVNVDWTDWNTLNDLRFRGAKTPAGTDAVLPMNWRGSWFYEFGATYQLRDGYFVSAGYYFGSNSTSEPDFNPVVPDTDLHNVSFAVGRHGPRWEWAAAAQILRGPWREVDDSTATSISGASANGRYRFFIPSIAITVGYHF